MTEQNVSGEPLERPVFLSPQDEEAYFSLSMQLLRSLQQSKVPEAFKAAEAMRDMLGGVLPEDSPAKMLLDMKNPLTQLTAYEEEDDEFESDEEASSSSEDSSSEEESDDEDEELEDDGEEEEKNPYMDADELVMKASQCPTAEEGLETILQYLEKRKQSDPQIPKLVCKRGLPVRRNKSRSASRKPQQTGSPTLPPPAAAGSPGAIPDGDEKDEIELCAEDLQTLMAIEAEVSREMSRLAIVRGNR